MKKFLVLILVLGVASAANATLSLSLDGGPAPDEITIASSDTVTIDVHTDVGVNSLSYLDIGYISEGTYSLSNPRLGPAAGDFPGSFSGYVPGDYDEFEITSAWLPASTKQAGDIFLVDLHCEGEGDVVVALYDSQGAMIDFMTIHQVPEPMTIALLGLGGLLLRRRK